MPLLVISVICCIFMYDPDYESVSKPKHKDYQPELTSTFIPKTGFDKCYVYVYQPKSRLPFISDMATANPEVKKMVQGYNKITGWSTSEIGYKMCTYTKDDVVRKWTEIRS